MTSNRAKFEPSSSFRSSATVDTHRRTDQSYKPKGWAKNCGEMDERGDAAASIRALVVNAGLG
jgi:hypothetical protein